MSDGTAGRSVTGMAHPPASTRSGAYARPYYHRSCGSTMADTDSQPAAVRELIMWL